MSEDDLSRINSISCAQNATLFPITSQFSTDFSLVGSVSFGMIALATSFWTTVGKYAVDLVHAKRKTDINFLRCDREKKRDKAFVNIQLKTLRLLKEYQDLFTSLAPNNNEAFLSEFERLTHWQTTLDQNKSQIKTYQDRKKLKRIMALEKERKKEIATYIRFKIQVGILDENNNLSAFPPSDKDEINWLGHKAVAVQNIGSQELRASFIRKQEAKARSYQWKLSGATLAAVGLTTFALFPLAGPIAPFIALGGLVLASMGMAALLREMLYRERAQQWHIRKVKQEIKKKYTGETVLKKTLEDKINDDILDRHFEQNSPPSANTSLFKHYLSKNDRQHFIKEACSPESRTYSSVFKQSPLRQITHGRKSYQVPHSFIRIQEGHDEDVESNSSLDSFHPPLRLRPDEYKKIEYDSEEAVALPVAPAMV